MSAPVLNLLRQPQASSVWGLWLAGLSGVWLGATVGLVCHGQLAALQQAQVERQKLAAAHAQQLARANAQRQAQAQQAIVQREAQARWQQQRRWHATLSALAHEQGLRVQAWQGGVPQRHKCSKRRTTGTTCLVQKRSRLWMQRPIECVPTTSDRWTQRASLVWQGKPTLTGTFRTQQPLGKS